MFLFGRSIMIRKMNQQRLEDWFAGKIPDDELSNSEIDWLEEAVFNAVVRKISKFPEPRELH